MPPATQPASPSHDLLVGRFGLRAGWGIALFTVAVYLGLGLLVPGAKLDRAGELTPGSTFRAEFLSSLLVLVLTWLLSRLERRSAETFGFAHRHTHDLLPGSLAGLVLVSALVGTLHAAGLLFFDSRLLQGAEVLLDGLDWLAVCFFIAVYEESLFRGYLQYTLTRGLFGAAERLLPKHARGLAFAVAAFVLSTVFALLHLLNPVETGFGIVAVFLAGLVFSYALWRTGSLWWSIGFHTAWDWAQSFLFGVPDSGTLSAGRLLRTHAAGRLLFSGGIAGPEGSVLVVPTFLLVALLLRYTTRASPQPTLAPLPEPAAPSPIA